MRLGIAGLCFVAAAALAGCASLGEPPDSTARAIDSDIAAAHASGPTASQLGQASVVPDVIEPRSGSVAPMITIPMNNAY